MTAIELHPLQQQINQFFNILFLKGYSCLVTYTGTNCTKAGPRLNLIFFMERLKLHPDAFIGGILDKFTWK